MLYCLSIYIHLHLCEKGLESRWNKLLCHWNFMIISAKDEFHMDIYIYFFFFTTYFNFAHSRIHVTLTIWFSGQTFLVDIWLSRHEISQLNDIFCSVWKKKKKNNNLRNTLDNMKILSIDIAWQVTINNIEQINVFKLNVLGYLTN